MSGPPSTARHQASCTECQRRKQKCSRTWPCDHCRTRRTSHQCHFETQSKRQTKRRFRTKQVPGLQRDEQDCLTATSDIDDAERPLDINDAIAAWGYMPEQDHFNLPAVGDIIIPSATSLFVTSSPDDLQEDVARSAAVTPIKSVTDLLVHNFVHSINYFNYAIYPPQFLSDYTKWWDDKTKDSPLSPTFTCLLTQICACSVQYLEGSLRTQVEAEIGGTISSLANRYHQAARRLSRCIEPGEGGLMHVQQLLLSVAWYKAESKFVQAWHALGAAIREAQEIGLHRDSLAKNCSEFDVEMRRRIWCILYLWDWNLSKWLCRPRIIDPGSCSVAIPCGDLEQSGQSPAPPSPFLPFILQYKVALLLSDQSNRSNDDPKIAARLLDQVEKWRCSFPETFHLINPDTSWDIECPFLPFQRKHLHLMATLFELSTVKHVLTKDPADSLAEPECHLRAKAIDICIRNVRLAHDLFEIMASSRGKGFIVICVAFTTTTLLLSVLIRDTERSLPRRDAMLKTIKMCLEMSEQIRGVVTAGTIAYNILSSLVRSLPLYFDESTLFEPDTSKMDQNYSNSTSTERESYLQYEYRDADVGAPGNIDHNLLQEPFLYTRNSDLFPNALEDRYILPTEDDFMNTDWNALTQMLGSLDDSAHET